MSDPAGGETWQPSRPEQRLRDIVAYCQSILATVAGFSSDQFEADVIRQKAVAFDFQCVSEAAARLLEMDRSLSVRYPSVPWSSVRALANVTRHEYGRLDVGILWRTATGGNLQELMRVANAELRAYEAAARKPDGDAR